MNKKTFTLAVIFLICALGWLGANVYWRVTRSNCVNAVSYTHLTLPTTSRV